MSREIKFRAWDKELKMMDYDFYLHSSGKQYQFAERNYNTPHIEIEPCDLKVMQCTELKGYMNDAFNDCEQKDVYQGDHITITYDGYYAGFYAEEKYSGVVDLDDTGTAFVLRNADYERQGEDIPNRIGDMEISFSFPDDDDLEQIYLHAFELVPDNIIINGNIYENPELLKEDTR